MNLLMLAMCCLFMRGVGVWGINIPVGWGFAIVNFVWWIGIGHAGTLISAILLLLKQDWRTSINRFSEAMTLFAVACAGMFPILHLGRPWLAYWLLPYPNTMWLWPQPRSPLMWDVFAVSHVRHGFPAVLVYRTDSGSRHDARPRRNRCRQENLRRSRAGLARLGHSLAAISEGLPAAGRAWRRRWWSRCTPSSASILRSASCRAGTPRSFRRTSSPARSTPGFAMVLTLDRFRCAAGTTCEDLITMRHIESMAKVMLGTGLIVAYGYVDGSVHGLVQRRSI